MISLQDAGIVSTHPWQPRQWEAGGASALGEKASELQN